MPHLIIEYSANIDEELMLDALMLRLRDSAVATGVFPLPGIRVRAARRDRFVVADGDPENAFVHLMVRIGHGRTPEVRRQVADRLFAVLCDHLREAATRRGLGLSLEIQEIDPVGSLKRNNLHERLAGRAAGHVSVKVE
ncbi:MAG TPA: 5-carboxymethyl-2-hydroxymuconate Delta-isomerase [Pseudomonadales bacterium]